MSPPRRVVSLVPSLTETLFALGVGDRLVGVTRYCAEPAAAVAALPKVGGTKNPDLERIAALAPDLVLVNSEENRPEHIAALRERCAVHESMPRTVVEAAGVVRDLGALFGRQDEAAAVTLEIEAQILRGEVVGFGRAPVRVFLPIWLRPWMAVNRDTYVHDVLTRAGAVNVTADRAERYPELRPDEVQDLAVELVLLPSEPYAFTGKHRDALLAERPFGRDVAVVLVDGRDYCWHGAHTPAGLAAAIDTIRPFRRFASG